MLRPPEHWRGIWAAVIPCAIGGAGFVAIMVFTSNPHTRLGGIPFVAVSGLMGFGVVVSAGFRLFYYRLSWVDLNPTKELDHLEAHYKALQRSLVTSHSDLASRFNVVFSREESPLLVTTSDDVILAFMPVRLIAADPTVAHRGYFRARYDRETWAPVAGFYGGSRDSIVERVKTQEPSIAEIIAWVDQP